MSHSPHDADDAETLLAAWRAGEPVAWETHPLAVRQAAADRLLLESLLARTLRGADPAEGAFVARVLERIRNEDRSTDVAEPAIEVPSPVVSPSPRRTVRLGLLTALAAGLLLVLWFGRPTGTASTALAALRQAAAAEPTLPDREYAVTADFGVPGGTAVDGKLYVRGGNRFVATLPGPLGETIVGTNGDRSWIVPATPLLPVRVGPNPELLARWLADGRVSALRPALEMSVLLERLATKYDLRRLPDQIEPHGGRVLHVVGTGSAEGLLPDGVDVRIDAVTGMVRRLELTWSRPGLPLRSAVLRLVGNAPLPVDWFDHSSHHAPDRQVFDVKSDDAK